MRQKFLFILILMFSLSGCIVYKQDIQQGNEITPEMVAQLELGMSKREVTRVLGFPLVTDPFHVDRWDYYYFLKQGKSGEIQQSSVSLTFENDQLITIAKQ